MLVDVFYYIKLSMGIFLLSLFITLFLILLKKPIVNGYTMGVLAIISCIVSGALMIISGYIADEVPSGGDPTTFYMFLVILFLNIVNLILFSVKKVRGD